MRRFFGFLLTMALLGGGVFWLPYLQAEPVDNVYQAADLLRQDAENGGNGVAFREDNVDADEVYRALEAQYPYAFALHAVTRLPFPFSQRSQVGNLRQTLPKGSGS